MIDNFKFGHITVIGDIILDHYIMGEVHRVSPEAPVPVLLRSSQTSRPGGAANVAANAAALGCHVTLIGIVGPDKEARILQETLHPWPQIDTSSLITSENWDTITKTRIVSGRQQIVRIDHEQTTPPSQETYYRLIEATCRAIEHTDIVVCSDYAKGALSDAVINAIMQAAQAHSVPVIVDPKRPDFSAYRGASLITPNLKEMALATQNMPLETDQEVERASQKASEQFGGDVLLTRSEAGMSLWCRNGRILHRAARKSEVFDVSGAGDTVIATIASILSAGQTLEMATTIATTAASIAVRKLGTSVVSRDELNQELKEEIEDKDLLMPIDRALTIINEWKRHGATIVFTNGCFDLLHPGHISLIEGAAKQGDKLIVALNSDQSVKRLKGAQRPLQNEHARAKIMSALRHVDMVLIFEEDTPLELIKKIKPHTLVKGADYKEEDVVGGDVVKEYGGKVALITIIEGQSTTHIVKRMS
ncbi:D-glycero-beta-D-manno-heptose-7-phosphate kinase [Saccharibacter sp. 17.LH.SD]|uniref:D-glycero-beta-D-manno-heptose-7-phosphate kinase n=1 Tax=Saccharibacter sp. 17.LH.SD TaxID=2689393 RepID=UPI001368F75E|nr:D-glycero-beta-D-manno-heptose-7-phosphate kinase [Saccharibacter sp. 17.LH.SD]MXV43525.1 D-glycero-beta-D-manno-heptose-7-phosphate kinase [Saccharibacter sp. 17.LH.SD]